MRLAASLLLSLASLALAACGKKPEPVTAAAATSANVVDTYALFPAGAIGLASLDVTALLHAGKTGEALGHFLSDYSPLGPESGVSLEANVDRLTCATYQLETADLLCVADGKFDAAKLDKAVTDLEARAKADPQVAGKAPAVVRTPYAGRTLVTASNVGFTVFDGTHLLIGTENAMRRALDRVRDGAPKRDLPKVLEERVVGNKADLAVSIDLANLKAMRHISVGPLKIHILQGLKEVYGTGQFKKKFVDAGMPGAETSDTDITLVTHLVYPDEARAAAEKDEAESLIGFNRLGVSFGYTPRLAKQEVTSKGNETIVTLGFKDDVLADYLRALPEKLNLPAPTRSAGATGPVPGADSK